jgi:hypothetical protein
MSTSDQDNICNVCCDKYNKSTMAKVKCEYGDCNYECCKKCVRQYLLSTIQDPHCMNCRKQWNQKFLVLNLNNSFVTNEYKDHMKILLCDREISKLPETMEKAAKYKQKKDLRKKIETILNEIKNLNITKDKLLSDKYDLEYEIRCIDNNKYKEQKKFIMACANNDCRGFLNSNYNCEICNYFTCSKCLEVIGISKDEHHECNENSVESAKLIKKETKPCPSCGTRIFKISGCDQMWCTECKNAFSWKSGKIETGVIHNPHFFEYQRSTINNPDDLTHINNNQLNMCNTNNIPEFYLFKSNVLKPLSRISISTKNCKYDNTITDLTKIYKLMGHITRVEITRLNFDINNCSDNEYYRILYINKIITKEELTKEVYTKDKHRRKIVEILNVYNLIGNVGKDILNGLLNLTYKTNKEFINVVLEQIQVFNNLTDYCNNQFKIISASYNCVTPLFKNYNIETQKHNISVLAK